MVTCTDCRDLMGRPVEMVRLYVKNKPSRMNQQQEKYNPIGYMCPQCKRVEVDLS